eukprot:TRINITY_DN14242_c0_g2_i1.p1 TRINITY_DN14242_c0_g2~~TRINITY_DN14242_c0_g2_i1.p1  ORF type:complete len:603 (-),score=31.19 TRINITY_DN14242_c0_g2_i1:56-1756(-)
MRRLSRLNCVSCARHVFHNSMRRCALALVCAYSLAWAVQSPTVSWSWCTPSPKRTQGRQLSRSKLKFLPQHSRRLRLRRGDGTAAPLIEVKPRTAQLPPLNSAIFRLAGPALCSALIEPMFLLIDTIFIGRIGATALSATAAASEVFTLALAVSIALRDGASSSIAREQVGTEEDSAISPQDAGRSTALASLILAVAVGLALSVAMYKGIDGLLWLVMGIKRDSLLHGPAVSYARIRAGGEVLALTCAASEGIHRGFGDTRTPLIAAVVAGVANVVLDYTFVVTLEWGVAGAAAATVLAQAVQCWCLLRSCKALGLFSAAQSPSPGSEQTGVVPWKQHVASMRKAVISIASTNAAVLMKTLSVFSFWVFIASLVTRQVGALGIAAYGVVLRLWLLAILGAEALAVPGQVLIARSLAAEKMSNDSSVSATPSVYSIRVLRQRLPLLALLVGLALAAAMLLVTPFLAPIFTRDAVTQAAITNLWPIAVANVPIAMVAVMCEGALLGGGLYRYLGFSMLFNTASLCGLSLYWMARAPSVETAWACLLIFFCFRLGTSAIMAHRLTRQHA